MKATSHLSKFQRDWWDVNTGRLSLQDWIFVDAMYRSRALDLPGTGHSMVPCIDMANHASGDRTGAIYETDSNGNAVLLIRPGIHVEPNDEITITYGDEKGASEMVFSYGFLEEELDAFGAKQLFLDLDIPEDDPLGSAKKAVSDVAPGFRLHTNPETGRPAWESQFVWWICVNQEDGLNFQVLQTNNGEQTLQSTWNGHELSSSDTRNLERLLQKHDKWPVFELRATVIIQERLMSQYQQLLDSDPVVRNWGHFIDEKIIRRGVWDTVGRLRELERNLIKDGIDELENKVRYVFLCPLVPFHGSENEEGPLSLIRNNRNWSWSITTLFGLIWPDLRQLKAKRPLTIFHENE